MICIKFPTNNKLNHFYPTSSGFAGKPPETSTLLSAAEVNYLLVDFFYPPLFLLPRSKNTLLLWSQHSPYPCVAAKQHLLAGRHSPWSKALPAPSPSVFYRKLPLEPVSGSLEHSLYYKAIIGFLWPQKE